MGNYKVYMHINNINRKRYYGITKQKVNKRWNSGRGYKNNEHFTNAINKYGWDNFKHEVLFNNLTKEEAELMEKFYIALYDTINPNKGYNLSLGGETGTVHTEETRKKISEVKKGKSVHTEESKKKISEATKGKNNPFYGKHHTEETRKKMSENHVDYKGKNHPNATKIYCVELDMYFDAVIEAGEFIGCCGETISKALRGETKTAKGYHWLYAKEVNEENINRIMSEEYNINGHEKKIYCVELGMYFNSVKQASKYIGCNKNNISAILNGRQKTVKGYHFIHAEDVSKENINKVMSEEKYANNKGKNNIMAKQIYCVELDMYFDTITEASKYVDCSINCISNVLNGRSKTAKGYHWLYAEDVKN